MLLTRIISAVILMPLVILGIYYLPHVYIEILAIIILGAAAWEFAGFMRFRQRTHQVLYVFLLCLSFIFSNYIPAVIVLAVGAVWWLLTLLLLRLYTLKSGGLKIGAFFYGIIGFLVFVPSYVGIVKLHSFNPGYLLFVLALIWATDIGGYLFGRLFGKHKLASQISPKKTVEGAVGGVVLGFLVAGAVALCASVPVAAWPLWSVAILCTVLFAIVGDLFESLLKRLTGVKDSGSLIPGHGGLYDRIDSVTAAVPVFSLFLLLCLHP